MKKLIVLAGLVLAITSQVRADELYYWDFNTDDANGATGTFSSRPGGSDGSTLEAGSGTSQVVNAAYTFKASVNDDPRVYEQSAVRITTFPGTTTSNKTAGIEFRLSTVGHEGITGTYQGYYSSAVSKYWRVQYTLDGSTWTDHDVIRPTNPQAWAYYSVDFGGVPGADNNPNFGFRIVAEWESTATGAGTAGYVGLAQGYNVGAQFWVDTMKITGNPIDSSNTRPTISAISTQQTTVGVTTAPIPFTIGDAQDQPENLNVEWYSPSTNLISDVALGGSGANRTITVTPGTSPGTAYITLKVSDTGGKYITKTFALNIRQTPPAGAVAYWDFNSDEQDSNPATGTFDARIGNGTAQVVNAGYSFMTSSTGLDPWSVDNTAVRMNSFPAATVSNKTAGIEFHFSTVGYEGISLQYDHNNGNTGSRYYRAQYTADGVNWIDHSVITNAAAGWFVYSVDFKGIRAADNNPNFGVRLVSEFESTATGTGTNAYVQSQSTATSYTTSGTFWIDRVTFTGSAVDSGNTAPTIAATNQIIARVNSTSIEIPFTIGDTETSAANLGVSWSTPTPTLISDGSITGSGANRTLSIVPTGQEGSAEVVLTVTDAGGKYTQARIAILIIPANTAPTISPLPNIEMLANTTSNVVATVNDLEDVNALTVTVESSTPWLLDSTNVVISGTGSERTFSITPAANQAGGAWVTVTVSDGTFSTSTSFMLKVFRSDVIAVWDFNSVEQDGNRNTGNMLPVVGNGTATSVGTATNSLGGLSATSFDPQTDDNSMWRIGGFPEQSLDNKISGAQFMFSTVGFKNIAAVWDHYNSASASKYWRIQYTLDGSTFVDYLVYTNPVVTTFRPTGVNFADIPGANGNPNFGIRIVSEFESTATGQGADAYVSVDNIKYGTAGTLWLDMVTFTAEPDGAGSAAALQIVANGGQIEISWPDTASGVLESAASLSAPSWQTVGQTPVVANGKKTVVLPVGTQSEFFRLKN